MAHPGYLIALFGIALAVALFFLYRQSRGLHLRCVQLCHRIANELSQRQEYELVVERVFNLIIEHTRSEIAILVYRSEESDNNMQVWRVHGVPERLLKAGDYLPQGDFGYGFGRLSITREGQIYHDGLREAVLADTGIELGPRQNMMGLPITSNNETHGLLQLVSNPNKPFSQKDIEGISGMGIYLDAAIQNAAKIETIRRQRDAAQSLFSIGLTISRFLDLDQILHHAVEETHRLLKSDFSWYMQLHDQVGDQGVVQNIAGDVGNGIDVGRVFPLGGRVAAMLAMEARDIKDCYILIRNLATNDGEGPPGYDTVEGEAFCERKMFDLLRGLQVSSGIVVPVCGEERTHGLLCSFSREPGFFDGFHVSLQQRIANQVLIAINTADYHAKSRRLALVEERQRMSDDLHDNMAQVINGLSLELHSFIKLVEAGQSKENLLQRLGSIKPQLDQAKASIREGIFELRIPEGISLWRNLAEFATSFEQWHDFKIHTDLPAEELSLGIQQQHELLRIVQEALWNIRKHSGQREAWLGADYDPDKQSIRIQVKDQGTGFSLDDIDAGQGITTMNDRISRLNGQLDIGPNEPAGAIISFEVPYHAS